MQNKSYILGWILKSPYQKFKKCNIITYLCIKLGLKINDNDFLFWIGLSVWFYLVRKWYGIF